MLGGLSFQELFVMFFISLVIPVVLLLIFREVVCWYWKINHIVRTLDSINSHLEKLSAAQTLNREK